jgi:hypothetical protein
MRRHPSSQTENAFLIQTIRLRRHFQSPRSPFSSQPGSPNLSFASRLVLTSTKYNIILVLRIGAEHLFQLLRELPNVGGDARQVGYYTGIIVRLPSTDLGWIIDQTTMILGVSSFRG